MSNNGYFDIENEHIKVTDGIYLKYPDLHKKEIRTVNATPDSEYPIRILEAYLSDENSYWVDNVDGNPSSNPLVEYLNNADNERCIILRKALRILNEHKKEMELSE